MKLAGMVYARFKVTDLARTESFAQDFGLITVERTETRLAMRTRGADSFSYVAHLADAPRFYGFGLHVCCGGFSPIPINPTLVRTENTPLHFLKERGLAK